MPPPGRRGSEVQQIAHEVRSLELRLAELEAMVEETSDSTRDALAGIAAAEARTHAAEREMEAAGKAVGSREALEAELGGLTAQLSELRRREAATVARTTAARQELTRTETQITAAFVTQARGAGEGAQAPAAGGEEPEDVAAARSALGLKPTQPMPVLDPAALQAEVHATRSAAAAEEARIVRLRSAVQQAVRSSVVARTRLATLETPPPHSRAQAETPTPPRGAALERWLEGIRPGFGGAYGPHFREFGVERLEDCHLLEESDVAGLWAVLQRPPSGAPPFHLKLISRALVALRSRSRAPSVASKAAPTPPRRATLAGRLSAWLSS